MKRTFDGLLPRLLIDAILPCALSALVLTVALTMQHATLLRERQHNGLALALERLSASFVWDRRPPQKVLEESLRQGKSLGMRYAELRMADGRLYAAGHAEDDTLDIYGRVLSTPPDQPVATVSIQVDPWPLRSALLLTWGCGLLWALGIAAMAILARWTLRHRVLDPVARLQHALDDLLPRRDECDAATHLSGNEIERLHASLSRIDQALTLQRRDLVSARRHSAVQTIRRQRDAHALSRSKSHFVALVGHHFRQPLQALQLFAAFLHTDSTKEQKAALSQMRGSIEAMTRLLDALLEMSRLDAGVVHAKPVSFSAATLFMHDRQTLSEAAIEHHVTLAWRGSHHGIHADADLCARLLQLLVSNALANAPYGRVLIAARRRGDCTRIEIRDNGSGIETAQQQHIFEEFVRLSADEGDSGDGYGLGLAIAERVAQVMGTQIGLRSRPGHGSTFWFDVPRAPAIDQHRPLETPVGGWRRAS
ncbi:HAMP domain-containing sensor histidine kinase [Dyella sp.]|uniref:sensor histidine kinase n=1 Tax=Dyella sp. TaxID=1869338 RepID=UPI002ED2838F